MLIATLTFSAPPVQDTLADHFTHLIHNLHHQGAFIDLNNHLYQNEENVIIQAKIPEKAALDLLPGIHWYQSLLTKGVKLVSTHFSQDLDAFPVCSCEKPSTYVLLGSISIPLNCGICRKKVPLYRIPHTSEKLKSHYELDCWNKENLAWSAIEFYSAEEAFAFFQLCDFTSSHNQKAMDLRESIERITGLPCYFFLPELRSVSTQKAAEDRECPSCGANWKRTDASLPGFEFQCAPCRLVSEIGPVEHPD